MLTHLSESFPQGFPPAPPSQPFGSSISISEVLDLRKKRRIVKSTGLVKPRWIPWHCNAIDALGPTAYLDIYDAAKLGRNPATLFTWLIREELADREQEAHWQSV